MANFVRSSTSATTSTSTTFHSHVHRHYLYRPPPPPQTSSCTNCFLRPQQHSSEMSPQTSNSTTSSDNCNWCFDTDNQTDESSEDQDIIVPRPVPHELPVLDVVPTVPYSTIDPIFSVDQITYVAANQAVRIYDPTVDEQFRSYLSSSNKTKGLVTHRSHIFTDTYILPPSSLVSEDALRSISIDNAGGQSDISEMYSIDYFTQMYGATNTILETEVSYWINYKMVDFISTIDGHRVGVSVARAMGFPTSDKFTPDMAARLLYKKLYGLIVARNGVVKNQSFFKSVLHIWCQDFRVAQLLHEAFSNLDANDYGLDVKGIVLLQLTVCDDPQLYKNVLR